MSFIKTFLFTGFETSHQIPSKRRQTKSQSEFSTSHKVLRTHTAPVKDTKVIKVVSGSGDQKVRDTRQVDSAQGKFFYSYKILLSDGRTGLILKEIKANRNTTLQNIM